MMGIKGKKIPCNLKGKKNFMSVPNEIVSNKIYYFDFKYNHGIVLIICQACGELLIVKHLFVYYQNHNVKTRKSLGIPDYFFEKLNPIVNINKIISFLKLSMCIT